MHTIDTLTIKLFGKKETVVRVLLNGEVVQVCEDRAEAEAWIAKQ